MSISEVTEVALALANFRAGSAQLWERVEARVVDRDALEKLRRGNADMLEPEWCATTTFFSSLCFRCVLAACYKEVRPW